MLRLNYFLFENFDADAAAPDTDPRRYMNGDTTEVLAYLLSAPGAARETLCDRFVQERIDRLFRTGFLCERGGGVSIGFPLFLRQDADILEDFCAACAETLADALEAVSPRLKLLVGKLQNGFSDELNLYHLLCGTIFDGMFFDALAARGAVAVSKPQPSGLDYILTAYEACPELDSFSNRLLCSYNRYVSAQTSLQSFGDADGNRHDFYRFARKLESGEAERFDPEALAIWDRIDADDKRAAVLNAAGALYHTGSCDAACYALLSHFGYAADGRIAVPVYGAGTEPVVRELLALVEETVGERICDILLRDVPLLPLFCVENGCSAPEIANELYHLLFGSVNEALVRRGVVAGPPYLPGEGRYLQCMEC